MPTPRRNPRPLQGLFHAVPAVAGLAAALSAGSAYAGVLAEDSFNAYATGALDGQTPPAASPFTGFATDQGTPEVVAGDLGVTTPGTSQVLLNQSPGNAVLDAALDLSPTGPFAGYLDGNGEIGADGTTLYFGFALQVSGQEDSTASSSGVIRFEGGTPPATGEDARILIGKEFNRSTFNLSLGGGTLRQTLAPFDTDEHFIVLRIDFAAGVDTVTAYFDPIDGLGESAAGQVAGVSVVDEVVFTNLEFRSRQLDAPPNVTNDTVFDDVIFGTTFESVFPCPSPVR